MCFHHIDVRMTCLSIVSIRPVINFSCSLKQALFTYHLHKNTLLMMLILSQSGVIFKCGITAKPPVINAMPFKSYQLNF